MILGYFVKDLIPIHGQQYGDRGRGAWEEVGVRKEGSKWRQKQTLGEHTMQYADNVFF